MAEDMSLGDLERELAALAPGLAWPPTPELSRRVRARIERRFRPGWGVLLVAAAIAVALGTQAVVGGLIQIRGLTMKSVPTLPSPSALAPGDIGARYDLGVRYGSVGQAGAVAGFKPLVPAALGAPDEVYWRADPGVLTMVYRPRPGLPPSQTDSQVGALLMEARGSVTHQTFIKLQGPATAVQAVRVGGSPGFWVAGAPHGFLFYGAVYDSVRLSGDTLVWNQAQLVVRLESGLGRDASIRLAQTLH